MPADIINSFQKVYEAVHFHLYYKNLYGVCSLSHLQNQTKDKLNVRGIIDEHENAVVI